MKLPLILGLITTLNAAFPTAEAQHKGHHVTANAGLFSQYVFRGLAQTDKGPALQGGFDYSYSSSPATVYVGMWGSNIGWLQDSGVYLRSNLELDFYGGIRGIFGRTQFSWDVGYLYYWYPGDLTPSAANANSQEIYGGLGWNWVTGKISCSTGSALFAVRDSRGTYYVDLSASPPLGESGFTLLAHYGFQRFTGSDPALAGRGDNDAYYSYDDWKAGLNYDAGKLTSRLKGVTVGAYGAGTHGADPCGYGSITDACRYGGFGVYPQNIATAKLVIYLQITR